MKGETEVKKEEGKRRNIRNTGRRTRTKKHKNNTKRRASSGESKEGRGRMRGRRRGHRDKEPKRRVAKSTEERRG